MKILFLLKHNMLFQTALEVIKIHSRKNYDKKNNKKRGTRDLSEMKLASMRSSMNGISLRIERREWRYTFECFFLN